MAKHELDIGPRRYNLRAKKQRTEVTPATLDQATPAKADAKETPARKPTVKSRTKRQNNHSRLTLDNLPAKLLRQIYLDLDAPAMLAFKLVSKSLYETTLDQRGGEVVDVPGMARTYQYVRDLYAMMIDIESGIPSTTRVDRLTCSECCRTMGHAPSQREPGFKENGFPDESFDRNKPDRL